MGRRVRKGHGEPCHWCGRPMLNISGMSRSHPLLVTRDHVLPKSAFGGDEDENNIVMSCRACNEVKGSKLPSEWDAFRKAVPEWWNLYKHAK